MLTVLLNCTTCKPEILGSNNFNQSLITYDYCIPSNIDMSAIPLVILEFSVPGHILSYISKPLKATIFLTHITALLWSGNKLLSQE